MSRVWDLFCGAGGASTGLVQAALAVGQPVTEMVAVNHWAKAVETHRRNHPWATVLHEDVSRVDPVRAMGRGKAVKLGTAGPSCVYHSRARGGKTMKPINEQERSHAWDVLRWARLTEPENLLIENVEEFQKWGPMIQVGVNPDGSPAYAPDPTRKGEFFQDFLKGLRALGYNVEYRILCSAHYGDATTRRRLFIQARRGKITWPEPSHRLRDEEVDLFRSGLPIARSAREIIDWNLRGKSIFDRKKPLAPATAARVMEGLRRYAGGPFIVPQLSGAKARGLDDPLNTITATGTGNALVQPFVMGIDNASGSGSPTLLDFPISTITGKARHVLVEPFLLRYNDARRVQSVDDPFTTLDGSNRIAVVQPFLLSYYGTGHAHDLGDALPTITGKDRFALVETFGEYLDKGVAVVLDIHLRMLQPHELAAAHSFPEGYQFVGTKKDAVKMVGNSWAVKTAQALCQEILA